MNPRGSESLTLEVTGPQADELGPARRKMFDAEGGTIGRAADSDWVLADPYVSSRHASIEFHDGTFVIKDLNSRNGVFVNDQRLDSGSPCALKNGDRVFIEPYEMVASMDDAVRQVKTPPSPVFTNSSPALPDLMESDSDSVDDWLHRLGPPPDSPLKRSDQMANLDRGPLQEAVRPIVAKPLPPPAPAAEIPFGYDPIADIAGQDPDSLAPIAESSRGPGERRRGDRRQDETVRPVGKSVGNAGTVDLAALLSGAGLEGATVSPEVAAQLGQILRIVVAGLLEVLKSRQEIKREFGIRHTVIERRGNNPLKFAVDVEDALHNLLVKKNPGYLGPVAAFEDAFVDVRHHQMAMLKGVGEAFEQMLAHFHPDRLQQEFNRHTPRRSGLQVLQGKPDYWEHYREFAQRLASNQEHSFRVLFGEEFAKAYQQELDRLKEQLSREQPLEPRRGERER